MSVGRILPYPRPPGSLLSRVRGAGHKLRPSIPCLRCRPSRIMGRMREVVHALCSLGFGVFALLALRDWLTLAINAFRAAANRRPGIRWYWALKCVLLGSEVYTETGERMAERARSGCASFFLFWLLGMIAALIWSATAATQ